MRIQAGTVRQLQGRTAGTVGRDWGRLAEVVLGRGPRAGGITAWAWGDLSDLCRKLRALLLVGRKLKGKGST